MSHPGIISDEIVEKAANHIWPLADLSSDEARDELRRDVRRALEEVWPIKSLDMPHTGPADYFEATEMLAKSEAQLEGALSEAGRLANDRDAFGAAVEILRNKVKRLEEALAPFAALAEELDYLRHADNSTCTHRLRAGDIYKAREVLK